MKATPPLASSLIIAISAGALFSSTASAQNLSERIDHVMQKRTAEQARNTSKAHLLGVLTYTDISVQFQETPARDAINYLQTILGINITARYNTDRVGTGLDPEAPITLNVVNRPALNVLEMVLEQAAPDEPTTWQVREGFVEVGTKERLSSAGARELRYYPIRDLLMTVPNFNNAPSLDLSSINQQGGGAGGGRGGGGGGGGGLGGGRGGGGSGGGTGGQGGGLFGGAGAEEPRLSEAERAQQIVDLITDTVEFDAWDVNGGTWATIRYYQGTLIVRAPDYIHRQIGGYPFAIRPAGAAATVQSAGRYVMFDGRISNIQLIDVTTATVTSGAGGSSAPANESKKD